MNIGNVGGLYNNYLVPVNNIEKTTPANSNEIYGASVKVKGTTECSTCENRQYVDGSDENNVSFKTPGHISPEQSYAKVMSHEQEHVSNAIAKGNKPGASLLSATISLKMSTCPECGRQYVAGGTTKTLMKYSEEVPYEKGRKLLEGSFLKGMKIDATI